jgi:hypothetical protein
MLYMAAKNFDINNVPVQAGKDIVDVTGMEPDRLRVMLDNHYLIATDKKVATVDVLPTVEEETREEDPKPETREEDPKPKAYRRVSPLARQPKVFKTRLAKRGE